ncbi:MAG: pyridoxamine 5'-phosphate oxidase family protein, partial [Acidimicrobiia bacterium]
WYLWTGKEFILSTRPTTAKWKNLRRDPRCSLCVDDPETGQMAVAYGDAVLLEDEIEDLTRQVCAKYYDREELIEQHLSEIFEKTRSIIIVRPKSLVARRVKTRRGLSSPSENEH